ncbi:MAG: lysophospholipid acyltransferase family protein [Fluviicola sp.]
MGAKIGYYIFILPLSYLPLPVLYIFTDFFYLILITLVPYRKKVILGNIHRSFPELSANEHKKLVRKFYHHFTDILAEGVKNLTISEKELRRRFKVKNPELMHQLYVEKRNVLLVSGHFNNWEWLITSQNFLFPHQAYGIGMPLSSQFWHKKVTSRRERFGMRVVHAKNYREKLSENPDELKAVLVLSDQSPGNSLKSYWMNFLNQQTAVLFGAEMMANELDYAVVFFATRKMKRGHYEMELKLLTNDPRSTKWGEITEGHTKALEKEIKNNPAQWLWSHKRWKREVPEDLKKLKTEQNEKFNARYR